MDRRTICFFNSTRAWGGGEKWHFDMITKLDPDRYRVIAVADRAGELYSRLSRVNIPLHGVTVSNISFLSPLGVRKIVDLLASEKVDTVIMNLPSDLKLAGPAAASAGVRNIIYRRGSAIPVRNTWLNRRLFKKYITGIIANSEETKRTILANNPDLFDPAGIEVIYNGLDIDEWDSTPESRIYQAQPGEIVIGNAGRMVKQKGQESLIKIAVRLKEAGLDFRLLIAGDGPLRQRLEDMAEKAGVSDRTVFTGFVRNMKSFMESLDIFVLTSLWEGFGYVIVEAMAAAKPVVAFNSSSNPEIVNDGKTGILVSSIEEMAESIISLSADSEKMRLLGSNGRSSLESVFSMKTAVSNLQEYINNLTS
ncbi:MAG: glycosyltransferase [Candidatus Krumholzibacteria bacterium]|nr:glycosyltransferase [Candidatus Krumholzibacteria bacterium]